jgi:hypothetical protein
MSLFLLSLIIVALLTGFLTLLGRLLCAACGARWLRAPTFENYLFAASLGTAAWLLAFGLLSHLGFAAPAVSQSLLIGTVVFLAPVAWRHRDWLLLRRPGWAALGAGAVTLVTLNLTLLPAFLGDSFPPFGDQFTYVSISSWLQQHGFGETCVDDPAHPCLRQVVMYQEDGFRMGAIFLLASVEGLTGARWNALDVFPAVLTWGMLLCHGGIYLLCRWCLRVSPAFTLQAMVLAALTFNPLYFSSYSGLLPQLYGLATLAYGTALLTRLAPRGRWNIGSAALVGLTGSAMISSYSEFAPFLAVLAAAFTIRHYWRSRQLGVQRRFLRFTLVMLAALLMTGNVEYARMLVALPTQLKAVVGYHQPWSLDAFWAFASGVKPMWQELPRELETAATCVVSILIALGLVRLCRRRHAEPLLATVGLCGALALYFAAIAQDPWTGERGHTWSLYKLAQWTFPALAALEAAGLQRLLRGRPRWGAGVGLALGLGAAGMFLPIHGRIGTNHANALRHLADSPHPFHAWKQTGPRLDELGFRRVYLLHDSSKSWFPGIFAAYLLSPRPFASPETITSGRYDRAPISEVSADTALVVWKQLPFSPPHEALPGGFSLLNREDPVVLQVTNHSGMAGPANRQRVWVGKQPLELVMWAPRPGQAMLAFTLAPVGKGAARPVQVQWTFGKEQSEQRMVEGAEEMTVELSLPIGLSRFTLQCSEASTSSFTSERDSKRPLAKLTAAYLQWTDRTCLSRARQ